MKVLRTLLIALTAFAAWGCLAAASATTMTRLGVGSEDTLQVQLTCDQYGRCFRSAPRYYDDDDSYAPRYRTWNGCPYGYTVQSGECRPYQGPTGYYGYERRRGYGGGDYGPRRGSWNGCPYGFTVQDGVCKPYRGY